MATDMTPPLIAGPKPAPDRRFPITPGGKARVFLVFGTVSHLGRRTEPAWYYVLKPRGGGKAECSFGYAEKSEAMRHALDKAAERKW